MKWTHHLRVHNVYSPDQEKDIAAAGNGSDIHPAFLMDADRLVKWQAIAQVPWSFLNEPAYT
jgi:hypothetical protein